MKVHHPNQNYKRIMCMAACAWVLTMCSPPAQSPPLQCIATYQIHNYDIVLIKSKEPINLINVAHHRPPLRYLSLLKSL